MERHLWLLRHATAEYGSFSLPDEGRNLTSQGRQEAAMVGFKIAESAGLLDKVIASPSLRTRQTAEVVCQSCGYDVNRVCWDERIYEASVGTLVQLVASLSDDIANILLIGHNPGLEMLIQNFVDDGQCHAIIMQPASLAHIVLPLSWGAATLGQGKLQSLQHVAQY